MAAPLDRLRELVDRRGEVANRDVAQALGVSPATSHRLLRAAVSGGMLEAHGRGRGARYRWRRIRHRYRLDGLAEDRVWQRVAGEIAKVRSLAAEEKDSGVRVSNIYPGEVDTPILVNRPQPVTAEHRERILKPEDVAEAVLFVAKLPARVSVPELVIKPTSQMYV